MKCIRLIGLALAFLDAMPSIAQAQGAGIKWDRLNQEAIELDRVGTYVRDAEAVNITGKGYR